MSCRTTGCGSGPGPLIGITPSPATAATLGPPPPPAASAGGGTAGMGAPALIGFGRAGPGGVGGAYKSPVIVMKMMVRMTVINKHHNDSESQEVSKSIYNIQL